MLSAAELTAMQAVGTAAMPGTCIIWRDTLSAGPFSAAGSAVGAAIGTVCCRVRPGGQAMEYPVAGQTFAPATWIVTVPIDTDVRADDRIAYAGRVFHPEGGLGGKSHDITKKVTCTEINAGSQ